VKHEIGKNLSAKEAQLKRLGPERSSPTAQAAYLTELATQYQRLVILSLGAKFGSDERFESSPALRLAPAVMARSVGFDKQMAWCGHEYSFNFSHGSSSTLVMDGDDEADEDAPYADSLYDSAGGFEIRKEDDVEDVANILQP